MKTRLIAILALASMLPACSTLTPAQKQKLIADSSAIAIAAATAAATTALDQYNQTGKVDGNAVEKASINAAAQTTAIVLKSGTISPVQ